MDSDEYIELKCVELNKKVDEMKKILDDILNG